MAFFEEIGRRIANAGQDVARQTRNLTDTTRLSAKISENKKKMSQLLFEMGNDYYKKHRKDKDCEEQEYIDQLNTLFHEILKYQKEIEEINTSETCNVCGSRVSEGAAFCMKCGTKLDADELEDIEDDESILTCPSCGAEVDEDSAFCAACGIKLEDTAEEYSDDDENEAEEYEDEDTARICPTCGAEAEDDDVFCMMCGARLND